MDLREKLESIKQEGLDENNVENSVEGVEQGIVFDTSDTLEVPVEEPVEEHASDTALEAKEDEELLEEQKTEEYVPNFKYKAVGEEFEFDEDIKSLIKDKDSEERFRSIFAKAKGLEFYEEKHKKLEDSHNNLTVEYESKMRDATELATIVNEFNSQIASKNVGDQHRALMNAGLDEQSILNIAKQILDIRELSPQQRQAYNNQFEQKDAIKQYEQRFNAQEQQMQTLARQNAEAQVTGFLATQNDFMNEYEALEGKKAGDFRNDFISYGQYLISKGVDADLNAAMEEFKKVNNLKGVRPAPKIAEPIQAIPNVKSSGHSPIQKEFKSMDDLRAYMWK